MEIIRGRVPRQIEVSEAVAISAGGEVEKVWPGERMRDHIQHMTGIEVRRYVPEKYLEEKKDAAFVRHFKDAHVFCVVARAENDTRDARTIANAVEELMEQAQSKGYSRVHCQLLSAGSGRVFPARTSLIEMVRGYAAWFRKQKTNAAPITVLAIYLVAPDVLFDVTTHRINILELLTARDVRFWVQISRHLSEPERFLVELPGATLISELMFRFGIPSVGNLADGWTVNVLPQPMEKPTPMLAANVAQDALCTIDALGIFPNSVLSFEQHLDAPVNVSQSIHHFDNSSRRT